MAFEEKGERKSRFPEISGDSLLFSFLSGKTFSMPDETLF